MDMSREEIAHQVVAIIKEHFHIDIDERHIFSGDTDGLNFVEDLHLEAPDLGTFTQAVEETFQTVIPPKTLGNKITNLPDFVSYLEKNS